MALTVHKYGGTSMGSTERIKNVAQRVAKWQAAGHQMVVVPSAMSGETNRLIALAKEIQAQPDPARARRDRSTGEQVSVGLLAMALKELGVAASRTPAGRCRVVTDSAFTKARILEIDEARARRSRRRHRGRSSPASRASTSRATSRRWVAAVPTPRAWPSPRR
jgi:aspartate kinase